jgi:hypothetical protein
MLARIITLNIEGAVIAIRCVSNILDMLGFNDEYHAKHSKS